MQNSIDRSSSLVCSETIIANSLFKEFSVSYSKLFDIYDKLISDPGRQSPTLQYETGIIVPAYHFAVNYGNKNDKFFNESPTEFPYLFHIMCNWRKFKVVYNYPEEQILKRCQDFSDETNDLSFLTKLPFSTFFIVGGKEWNYQGIFVNIAEEPSLDDFRRTVQIDAISISDNVKHLYDINISNSNLSFKETWTDGAAHKSKFPEFSKHDIVFAKAIKSNFDIISELDESQTKVTDFILKYCYFLYLVTEEKRALNALMDKSTVSSNLTIENTAPDSEYVVVLDNLDQALNNSTISNKVIQIGKFADYTPRHSNPRKSPIAHAVSGYVTKRWCGSGTNRHLEERYVKPYYTGKLRLSNNVPVVEHKKKK